LNEVRFRRHEDHAFDLVVIDRKARVASPDAFNVALVSIHGGRWQNISLAVILNRLSTIIRGAQIVRAQLHQKTVRSGSKRGAAFVSHFGSECSRIQRDVFMLGEDLLEILFNALTSALSADVIERKR